MDIEPSDLIVGLMMAALGLIGLILASGAMDDEMYVFGLSLFGFACVFDFGLIRRHFDTAWRPTGMADSHSPWPHRRRLQRGGRQEIRHRRGVLGDRRVPGRRLHRHRTGLAAVQPRPFVHQLRPAAPGAHLRGDLRLRRIGAVRHLVLRRAAHLPRALVRRRGARRTSCSGATSSSSSWRRCQLRDGLQPEPGIRRTRMAYRPVADRRLGRLRC